MPLYEFVCKDCETTWEVRMPYKDPLPNCPECDSSEVRKVYQPAALIFKGSGWHVNDYASSKSGSNSAPKNGKSEDSGSGSSSASETKSEAKTETKSESPSASKPAD
jgi:putative FmdB family regulatory protein